MKMPTYSAEQILKILEQADKGDQTVSALCREHGIAEATFYRWRKTYRDMNVQEVQRLKELEQENEPIGERLLTPTEADIANQQRLLEIYRRTLSTYLDQRAAIGWVNAPPVINAGIVETRNEIRRIKGVLRKWGVNVDDHPDDEEGRWTRLAIVTHPYRRGILAVAVFVRTLLIVVAAIFILSADQNRNSASRGDAVATIFVTQNPSDTSDPAEVRTWTLSFVKVIEPGNWPIGEHQYSISVQCPRPYGTFESTSKFAVSNSAELSSHTLYIRPKGIFDEQFLGEAVNKINPSQRTIISFTLTGLTKLEAQRRSLDCKAFVEWDGQPSVTLEAQLIEPFINLGGNGPGCGRICGSIP